MTVLFFVIGGMAAGINLLVLWWSAQACVRQRDGRRLFVGNAVRWAVLIVFALLAHHSGITPAEAMMAIAGFVLIRLLAIGVMSRRFATAISGER